MTVEQLEEHTAYAMQFESVYEGYRWEIEPEIVWRLLQERRALHRAIDLIYSKCVKSGDIGLACIKAKEVSIQLWPAPPSCKE